MVTIKVVSGRGITVDGKIYRVGDTFQTDPYNAQCLVKTGKYVVVPAPITQKKEG